MLYCLYVRQAILDFSGGMGMEELLKEVLNKLNKLDGIENQLATLTEKQEETNQRLTKLEISIENNTNIKVQALFEDRDIVHSKLDKLIDTVAEVKEDITSNSLKIQIVDNKVRAIK